MNCKICHRKISNKYSLQRNMGRICYKKFNAGCRGIQISQEEDVSELSKTLKSKGEKVEK